MVNKILKIPTLLILFFIGIAGCENVAIFREPDLISQKGIKLGQAKKSVRNHLGKPSEEFSFKQSEHSISVWQYHSTQLDYAPVFEGDTKMSVFPQETGIHEFSRQEYRLVFVNGFLCSIEDFNRKRFQAISPDELPSAIPEVIEKIRTMDKH